MLRSLIVALLIAASLLLPGCSNRESGSPPNLLLISIDTLRADHLGCYGHGRPTSPFIDSLVQQEDVVLFEQCVAQAPNTAPSHMTLFTSLYPTVHGVPNLLSEEESTGLRLPQRSQPLARILKEAGYVTEGLVDGGYMSAKYGFEDGFDRYHSLYEGMAAKVDRAMDRLEALAKGEKPYFLFFHTYEVHAPYLPPAPFRDRYTGDYQGWIRDYCFGEGGSERVGKRKGFTELFKERERFTAEDTAYLMALYDGGIEYMDSEFRRLWEFLESRGMLENLVVVFLSDHGEEFGEHGGFGHKRLFEEVVHVPLFMRLPGSRFALAEKRVPDQVSLLDVMPTLLECLDLPSPSFVQGASLRSLWEGKPGPGERPAFSECIDFGPEPLLVSVRHGNRKLLDYLSGKRYELYDLSLDPMEKENRAMDKALVDEGAEMLQLLQSLRAVNRKARDRFKALPVEMEMTPEHAEELKQLGY